jgi:excinuclease UvrABC helicase subunit UvrB
MLEGQVIFYANRITWQYATVDDTQRRREKPLKYNEENGCMNESRVFHARSDSQGADRESSLLEVIGRKEKRNLPAPVKSPLLLFLQRWKLRRQLKIQETKILTDHNSNSPG